MKFGLLEVSGHHLVDLFLSDIEAAVFCAPFWFAFWAVFLSGGDFLRLLSRKKLREKAEELIL